VTCGPGRDVVNADEEDRMARDCERVTVNEVVTVDTPDTEWLSEERLRPVLTILNGTAGNDRLTGTRKVANRIRGDAGDDRIRGGGRRDHLYGGDGADTLLARGGGRDFVRCGRGHDRVSADRRDRVASDCEDVRR
jgi:Ca2+-binding RTX toxin-like protein